jgi:hypothetical protein
MVNLVPLQYPAVLVLEYTPYHMLGGRWIAETLGRKGCMAISSSSTASGTCSYRQRLSVACYCVLAEARSMAAVDLRVGKKAVMGNII